MHWKLKVGYKGRHGCNKVLCTYVLSTAIPWTLSMILFVHTYCFGESIRLCIRASNYSAERILSTYLRAKWAGRKKTSSQTPSAGNLRTVTPFFLLCIAQVVGDLHIQDFLTLPPPPPPPPCVFLSRRIRLATCRLFLGYSAICMQYKRQISLFI